MRVHRKEYDLLQHFIDMIPHFSANEDNNLEMFIEHCELYYKLEQN